MNFIQRLFGMAPDGGNGALEFLLLALPIAGIVYTSAPTASARPGGGAASGRPYGERGR